MQPSALHLNVPEQLKSYDVQTLSDCRQQLQEFFNVFHILCLYSVSCLINLAT